MLEQQGALPQRCKVVTYIHTDGRNCSSLVSRSRLQASGGIRRVARWCGLCAVVTERRWRSRLSGEAPYDTSDDTVRLLRTLTQLVTDANHWSYRTKALTIPARNATILSIRVSALHIVIGETKS